MTAARSRSKFVDPAVADYALDHSSGPDAVQLELQHVTAERTGRAAGMQIGDDQAVLLEILARAMAVHSSLMSRHSSRPSGPIPRASASDE